VQVVLTYMMVYTVDAALEKGKVAFNCVCADTHITLFTSIDPPNGLATARRARTLAISLANFNPTAYLTWLDQVGL
jgi:hypothetical protein